MDHGVRAGEDRRQQPVGHPPRPARAGPRAVQRAEQADGDELHLQRGAAKGDTRGREAFGPSARRHESRRRKGARNNGPRRSMSHRFRRQIAQFRQILLGNRRGRRERADSHGAPARRLARRLGCQRLRRAGRSPRVATPAGRDMRHVRPQQTPVVDTAAGEVDLSQLRTLAGYLQTGTRPVRGGGHHAPLRDQIHPLALRGGKRRAVHIRKDGQPIRTLHDRRVSGYFDPRVGELRASAAKRHVAVGGHLGAHRGRREAVDLPLARRRLAHPATRGAQGVGRRRHRTADTLRQLPQSAPHSGVQQHGHGARGGARQRRPRRRAAQGRGERLAQPQRLRRSARHAPLGIRGACPDPEAKEPQRGIRKDRDVRADASPRRVHRVDHSARLLLQRHNDPLPQGERRTSHGAHTARIQAAQQHVQHHDTGRPDRGQRPREQLRDLGHAAVAGSERLDQPRRDERLSRPRLRRAARRRRPRDPRPYKPAHPRRGIREDSPRIPARPAARRDSLLAGVARADSGILRREGGRHTVVPRRMGRKGIGQGVERGEERLDDRANHHTQIERTGAQSGRHTLLQLVARPRR